LILIFLNSLSNDRHKYVGINLEKKFAVITISFFQYVCFDKKMSCVTQRKINE